MGIDSCVVEADGVICFAELCEECGVVWGEGWSASYCCAIEGGGSAREESVGVVAEE